MVVPLLVGPNTAFVPELLELFTLLLPGETVILPPPLGPNTAVFEEEPPELNTPPLPILPLKLPPELEILDIAFPTELLPPPLGPNTGVFEVPELVGPKTACANDT